MDISSLRERPIRSSFTVSELNNYIKQRIDSDATLSAVTVCGEISNFTDHRSGHLYFTLKDSDSQIKAVMFKWQRARLKFIPRDGERVIVYGSLSVYPQGGTIQLYVTQMTLDGVGELYRAYELLKGKLESEGLFDESHKKLLPQFPATIGIITSPSGAAVQDIINVTRRRYPLAKLYLYPALVQGDGAEESLLEALDYLDASRLADVIIIGRGGGSIEDLWAFNSERLARRIFDARTPIISAVGHETDFTICDFVSDKRAPTPSVAAELAVPDIREIYDTIDDLEERAKNALLRVVERKRERLDRTSIKNVQTVLSYNIDMDRGAVSDMFNRARNAMLNKQEHFRTSISVQAARANALSPLSTMTRGYVIAAKNGKTVRSVGQISVGDDLNLRLCDGVVSVNVTNTEQGEGK